MNAEFLGTMQLASDVVSRSVDSSEILQYFSFLGFDRRDRSSKASVPDDSRDPGGKIVGPISRVVRIHGLFLLILLCSLRIVAFALPYLPHWMTDTSGEANHVHTSVADYIGLFAVTALAFIERRWLCSKPKTP
jgi:hypothetical protein